MCIAHDLGFLSLSLIDTLPCTNVGKKCLSHKAKTLQVPSKNKKYLDRNSPEATLGRRRVRTQTPTHPSHTQTPKPPTHTYDTIGTHSHPNPSSHVRRSEDEASFANPCLHLSAPAETFFWGTEGEEVYQKTCWGACLIQSFVEVQDEEDLDWPWSNGYKTSLFLLSFFVVVFVSFLF